MKTLTTLTKLTLAVVVSSVLTVACGTKGESGGSNSAPNPCAGVANGMYASNGQICQLGQPVVVPGGSGQILNNVQFDTPHMRGSINLMGIGNADWMNPQIYAYYYGSLIVNGTLQILDQSYCGAPVGTYSLVSNGVMQNGQAIGGQWAMSGSGTYASGVLSGLTLTAVGPASIQFVASGLTSQVYNPNGLSRDASGNRIGLNVNMVVNGMPCGFISTF